MRCPSCQADLDDQARFCSRCGASAVIGEADAGQGALARALGSQYRMLRLLGRGGMGTVHLARDEALDRLVAIKLIRPDLAAADARERFRREARTAARLAHPRIVPLHAFGEADGNLYFVMAYVSGESLGERLRREAKLSAGEARRILAELADALDHAHRQGVVHRDVKPENVLIEDESGGAKLTDFGIAKLAAFGETLTRTGNVVGTPRFMSPEQGSGKPVDARSDLYSLGVLGYQMLSGHPPFEGTTAQEVILQHLTKEPPPLRSVEPSVPEDLAAIVMRCLAKEPAARWPDAASLRQALSPGSGAEEELPAGLETLQSRGLWALPWLGVLAYLVWLEGFWIGPGPLGRLGPVGPLGFLTAVFFLLGLRNLGRAHTARRRGFSWSEIFRAAFRQPPWWPCWYPRLLRRPGDVWDRLPRGARWLRGLLAALAATWTFVVFVVFALMGPVRAPAAGEEISFARRELLVTDLALAGFFLGSALGLAWFFLGRWWSLRQGLDPVEGYGVLVQPTSRSSFWRKPQFEALLEPVAARSEPLTPRGFLESIERAARSMDGSAALEAARACRQAGRLVARLDELEAEIARLRIDADPEEAGRLEARLAGLGLEGTGQSDEMRRLRTLLSQQLDLMRLLGTRLQEAQRRREMLLDLLRRLWRAARRLEQTPLPSEEALRDLRSYSSECEAVAGEPATTAPSEQPTIEK